MYQYLFKACKTRNKHKTSKLGSCRYSLGSLSARKFIRGLVLSGGVPSFHSSSGAFLLLCHLPPLPFLPELELDSPFFEEEWRSS